MNLPEITIDNDCIYLTQDLCSMNLFDKSKAIVDFCQKETKIFEKEVDRLILKIFERNGINVPNTEKSVLKLAFDLLNAKGKEIVVEDIYENTKLLGVQFVKYTKNHFTVMLEDNRYIQCGVRIEEKEKIK